MLCVTGFEPFASHKINASWVAVNEMSQSGGLGDDINLIVQEIPVVYDTVGKVIPQLWNEYRPKVCNMALC